MHYVEATVNMEVFPFQLRLQHQFFHLERIAAQNLRDPADHVVNLSGMLGAKLDHSNCRFTFFMASTISIVSTLTRVTRMRRSMTFSL